MAEEVSKISKLPRLLPGKETFTWLAYIQLCSNKPMHQRLSKANFVSTVHIEDDPSADIKQYLEIFQDLQMVARMSMFFAKLSILLLYIRLFFPKGVTRSLFWWIIQAVVWLNLLYTVGLILAIALQCVPYHKSYGASCMDQYMVLISASIINIISDLLVLMIPMASVWRLNMSHKRKWAVWALFAFG